MSDRQKHCIVIGVGPGTGLATVKHFAENGYFVSMIARHAGRLTTWESEIPNTKGYQGDIAETEAYCATLRQIVEEQGVPNCVIFNATLASFGRYEDIKLADFERNFRVNTAGFPRDRPNALPRNGGTRRGLLHLHGQYGFDARQAGLYRLDPNQGGSAHGG